LSVGHRSPRPQPLLDAIDAELPTRLHTTLWRIVSEGRDPLQPGRAGGRWDDGSFDVLYTSTSRDGACAESWFHLRRGQPIPPSKPRKRIVQIAAELDRVLDLSGEGRLAALGVNMQIYGQLSYQQRGGEYPTTQQIGEVAFFYEYEAIVVPNARWLASNVVILTENARPSQVTVIADEPIELMKWHDAVRSSK